MSAILESLLTPEQRAQADEADRKQRALAHYTAEARKLHLDGFLLQPWAASTGRRVVAVPMNGVTYEVMVDAEGERVEALRIGGAWHDADALSADFRAALDEAFGAME